MKKWLILLLICACALWIGVKIKLDPGYVLLSYNQWSLEMPLWVAVILWVISTIGLVLLWKGLNWIIDLPATTARQWHEHREKKAKKYTAEGLIFLAEGQWRQAEKMFSHGLQQSHMSLLNHLGSAIAAQKQNQYDTRNEYLQKAHQAHPTASIAIGLTTARLQIEEHQWESALANLQQLHSAVPQNNEICKLLIEVAAELNDWDIVLAHTTALRKNNLFPAKVTHEFMQKAYAAHLDKLIDHTKHEITEKNIKEQKNKIDTFWKKLSDDWHQDPVLLTRYIAYLQSNGRIEEAETLLKNALKHHWDPRLIHSYAQLRTPDLDSQIKVAEKWLKQHPDDPDLLYILGALTYRQKLWGKARQYLQHSLDIKAAAKTYYLLAQVFVGMQDIDRANATYEKGLRLAADNNSTLLTGDPAK